MIKKLTSLDKEKREYHPTVLKTKEDVLTALYKGELKSSKFSLLSETEKYFIELYVFGDYKAEDAMSLVIEKFYEEPYPPGFKPKKFAYQIITNPLVQEVLDELTVARDKKFMVDLNRSRDMALNALLYIMTTTKDEALKAASAKTILDKASDAQKLRTIKEEASKDVTITIELAGNPYGSPMTTFKEAPIIIDIDETDGVAMAAADKQKRQRELARAIEEPDAQTGSAFRYAYMDDKEDEEEDD